MSDPIAVLKVRRKQIRAELAPLEENLVKAKDEVQALKDRIDALKAEETAFGLAVATLTAAAPIGG